MISWRSEQYPKIKKKLWGLDICPILMRLEQYLNNLKFRYCCELIEIRTISKNQKKNQNLDIVVNSWRSEQYPKIEKNFKNQIFVWTHGDQNNIWFSFFEVLMWYHWPKNVSNNQKSKLYEVSITYNNTYHNKYRIHKIEKYCYLLWCHYHRQYIVQRTKYVMTLSHWLLYCYD